MIKTQPIKKYIAPAIVATSIAVFSPVLIDEASANAGNDIEATSNTEVNTSSSSDSSEAKAENGSAQILGNVDITELQEKLSEKGQSLDVDGANGPDTEKAVRGFQSDEGLKVDGIVGDGTKDALGISTASASNEETKSNDSNDSSGDNEAKDGDPHAPAPAASGSAVDRAQDLVGTPYAWGGTDPDVGLDSSGFINAVFSDKGLERTHAGMWASNGTKVDNPQPGDVVFFEDTYTSGVSHSGVYIGNDQMIHSPGDGRSVEVTTPESWDYHWEDKYIGAKRF